MVVHLNLSHHLDDSRIKGKIIKSLINDGIGNVFIGHSKESEKHSLLKEILIPNNISSNRVLILSFNFIQIFFNLDKKYFFLHNFELLIFSPLLRILGKTVIYDAHEDYRNYIKQNDNFSNFQKLLLSKLIILFESLFANKICNFITCPTDSIKRNFVEKKIIFLPNYPLRSDFYGFKKEICVQKTVLYSGLISEKKGILQFFEIAKHCENDSSIRFVLCGKYYNKDLKKLLKNLPENISYLGDIKHTEVFSLLKRSSIGLCLLSDTPAYSESMPLKIFEYINSETFVIASNFKVWKFIDDNNLGILVNPKDTYKISKEIKEFSSLSNNKIKFYFDEHYKKLKAIIFQ